MRHPCVRLGHGSWDVQPHAVDDRIGRTCRFHDGIFGIKDLYAIVPVHALSHGIDAYIASAVSEGIRNPEVLGRIPAEDRYAPVREVLRESLDAAFVLLIDLGDHLFGNRFSRRQFPDPILGLPEASWKRAVHEGDPFVLQHLLQGPVVTGILAKHCRTVSPH